MLDFNIDTSILYSSINLIIAKNEFKWQHIKLN